MGDGVIIFFYVDDIIVAHAKGKDAQAKAMAIISEIGKKYTLTGEQSIQWFLGIEVVRDREQRLIWLSQRSYAEKIALLAEDKDVGHDTPMATIALLPADERCSDRRITIYQRKVGSIMYAAVMTRPDVAFVVSRLARFLANPSEIHQRAADRTLLYLGKTSSLSLQLGGDEEMITASDASFADNTMDRKSSQAYTMKLFGGLIGWRANKQDTVTTSTTEAELLALSQAGKEAIYACRLLDELSVKLRTSSILIQCDNKQTIRLLESGIAQLRTKLRHVDIHHHWLRQEVQNSVVKVAYVPSNEITADGLTKALPAAHWQRFLDQLVLVDIAERLQKRPESPDAP